LAALSLLVFHAGDAGDGSLVVLLLRLGSSGRGFECEEFFVEGDGALLCAVGEADDGAERVAGFAVYGKDFELRAAVRVHRDALFRVFAVEQGDAVAAGDGGNTAERVVIERVDLGGAASDDRLGGEGGIGPQGLVFRLPRLLRDVGHGCGERGGEEKGWECPGWRAAWMENTQ